MALGLFFVPASYAASPVTAVAKYGVMLQNGPDSDFQTSVWLPAQTKDGVPVIGRTPDNAWIQIEYQRHVGWVQATQMTVTGNLGALPAMPAPKPADVIKILAHFCTHPVVIPAAPVWPAGGEFLYHPDLDTMQVRNATTDELSPWNYYDPFYEVQSDLPTIVLCVLDQGILPGQICPYVDTTTGKPFSVQYFVDTLHVTALSVHTGQAVQLDGFTGQPDVLPDYQQLSTTAMTNQRYKDIATQTGVKFCPDHANPQILKMSGSQVTPEQVYSMFKYHVDCVVGVNTVPGTACTAPAPTPPAK